MSAVVPWQNMPATAADIPPELFNGVMYALLNRYNPYRAARQDKHPLALVSLTCRYFSEQLRPTLCETIKLDSRDDLLTLISFLDSPISRIKDYITYIKVEQYEPCQPWLHLLHTSLMCRLPHAEIVSFSLMAQEPVKLLSIHRGPPTSIPPACRHIERLNLTNFRLDSFDHLVKLVAGLPHLSNLRCERLVWPSVPPDTLPALRRYNRGNERWLFKVSMKNCAESWPLFWFLPVISQIERGDIRIMGRLIRCMLDWLADDEMTEDLSVLIQMYPADMYFSTIISGNRDSQFSDLLFNFTEVQPKSVVRLELLFESYWNKDRLAGCKPITWQEFDEQASSLRKLQTAELTFRGAQRLDCVRSVASEIIPYLLRLRNANKLRAAYVENNPRLSARNPQLDMNDLEGNLAELGGIKEEPSTSKSESDIVSVPPATDSLPTFKRISGGLT